MDSMAGLPMDDAQVAMPPGEILTLRHGVMEVEVAPQAGGRIAQIRVDGQAWLVGPEQVGHAAIAWGCYPMVPWAGRIREGRFTVQGTDYRLPLTLPPHAIHGVGFTRPWQVERCTGAEAELSLALPQDAYWPLGGQVHQRICIVDTRVLLEMSVCAGALPMPAMLGWHPWFRKPRRLDFSPSRMYPRDAQGMATLPVIAPMPGPWDDCFIHHGPIRLHNQQQCLELSSDCRHWVVYDDTPHATCVEPQTGPPDAFNLEPNLLAPGQCLRTRFTLAWTLGGCSSGRSLGRACDE